MDRLPDPPHPDLPHPAVARLLWQIPVGWTFTVLFTVSVVIVSFVTLGRASRRVLPAMLRFWGRWALVIQGVRLTIEGLENMTGEAPRIATFNHVSTLDAMIIPVLTPPGGVSAVKRELLYIPFVNMAVYLMGFLFIDRAHSAKGRETLQRAAARVEKERLTVFIAPEGTRSKTGALQGFKSGAFRLAIGSGAPVVPVVIDGAFEVHPPHHWACRPGPVRVRILPPVPTKGLTLDALPALSEQVHGLYEAALADMRRG